MHVGQLPEPGTAEFGQLALYRKLLLQGQLPQGTTFAQFQVAQRGAVEPGTREFAVRAALRKIGIARMPIPQTLAPPLLQEPAKLLRAGAKAAGQAALGGLKIGTAAVVIGLAALVGFALWRR